MSVRINPVHRDKVRQVWPSVHGFIAESCRKSGHESAYDLFRECLQNPAFFLVQYFEGQELCGAAIFQVDSEAVHGVACAGMMCGTWTDETHAFMARLARSVGVRKLSLEGRKGWRRLLARHGWKEREGIMESEV